MMGDVELIDRLNKSDKNAFEVLYDKYVGMVYGFLHSVLKDEVLAEDLTQWCFMQLWEHRQKISSDRNLPAWLYVTARNAAYKEARRLLTAERYIELYSKEASVSLQDRTYNSDMQVVMREISKCIDKMPESRKKIFLMRTAESKSVSEIAAELSISPKTVETQIARAKSFLRQHVSKLFFVAFFINLGL